MGWRGIVRDIEAAARRQQRIEVRRQRLLQKQQELYGKMVEFERARHEVAAYESQLETLDCVHRECADFWDWNAIAKAPAPPIPVRSYHREDQAKAAFDAYHPGSWGKLWGILVSKRERLRRAIDSARQRDSDAYEEANTKYREWQPSSQFASRILAADANAYLEAITETNPFLLGQSCILSYEPAIQSKLTCR